MSTADRPHLFNATFRANPAYELVLYESLAPPEREALKGLCGEPDFYGILRPRAGSDLAIQSMSCETALLFSTLERGGLLPGFVTRKLGASAEALVARLVLDGVLQIADGAGFISGAAAHAHVLGAPSASLGEGRSARLSIEALRYAEELQLSDVQALAVRLYLFNGIPLSPRLRRQFPGPDAVWAYLRPPASRLARVLGESWIERSSAVDTSPWRGFSHRHASPAWERREGVLYKLYVSPMLDALPETLSAAVEVFTDLKVAEFKIGRSLEGVLRPDKLVAYFPTFEALAEAAARLRRALSGRAAQGVPFTGSIDSDGLLSWGLDPPPPRGALPWIGRESFRLWMTRRLAASLVFAFDAPAGALEPWKFAVERLRLEGFDTRSWTPSARIWKDAPRPIDLE